MSHDAPLNAIMSSPHVHPTDGKRGELDNVCPYIQNPSRRLDLQSPLALSPISADHSPDLIDNLYLTSVQSTDSATSTAFVVNIYIPESTLEDIINILAAQLDDMQREGVHISSEHLHGRKERNPLHRGHVKDIGYTLGETILSLSPIP
jgi:hypothetical protein